MNYPPRDEQSLAKIEHKSNRKRRYIELNVSAVKISYLYRGELHPGRSGGREKRTESCYQQPVFKEN